MNAECPDCLWLQYMRKADACETCDVFARAWRFWQAAQPLRVVVKR